VEFVVGIVERILQDAGRRTVVLGRNEDEAIEAVDLGGPLLRDFTGRRSPRRRCDFIEERHRIIAQVDELELHVTALLRDFVDPARRLFTKAVFARRGNDYTYLWLCCSHGTPLRKYGNFRLPAL